MSRVIAVAKTLRSRLRRHRLELILALSTGALITITVLQLAGAIKVEWTGLALVLISLGLLAATLAPAEVRQIIDRITTVKISSVEIALRVKSYGDLVARQRPRPEDEGMRFPPVPDPADPEHPADAGVALTRLREQLRWRLAWTRRELDLPVEADSIEVIETLEGKHWLRAEEAALARDLLSEAVVPSLLELSRRDQREFFQAAWPFVWRIRVVVFDRVARYRFDGCGWTTEDFEQSKKYRPDFAAHKDDLWLRVTARVIDDEYSRTLQSARDHLRDEPNLPRAPDRVEDEPDLPPIPAKGVVVIPRTAPQKDELDGSPALLKLPVHQMSLCEKLDVIARHHVRTSARVNRLH